MTNSTILTVFEGLVLALSDCFSKRSRRYVLPISKAWILGPGSKTLKRIFALTLISRSVSGCYRFFSSFKGLYDEIARRLLQTAVDLLGQERVALLVDDTLSPKTGPDIFGVSLHCDHHTLPKSMVWGHNWVVVALAIRVGLWKRWVALPILARVYIRQKEARKAQERFRTKLQITVEMVDVLTRDLLQPVVVIGDGAFTNGSLIKPLTERCIPFIGRLRHDCRLYAFPPKRRKKGRGAPKRYGRKLAPLRQYARRLLYRRLRLDIYSKTQTLWVVQIDAIWKKAGGPVRVVAVKKKRDAEPIFLLSTDPEMTVEDIILSFSGRWSIEIAFRNGKGPLGLGQARVRTRNSVLRVTHFGLWLQTLVILAWVKVHGWAAATPAQVKASHRDKQFPSFADMLAELREEILNERIPRIFGPGARAAGKVIRFVRSLWAAA